MLAALLASLLRITAQPVGAGSAIKNEQRCKHERYDDIYSHAAAHTCDAIKGLLTYPQGAGTRVRSAPA